MKLFKNFKKDIHSHAATILGIVMAILLAWQDIDWTTFSFKRDWIKLALSAGLAIGGYLMKFNIFKTKEEIK